MVFLTFYTMFQLSPGGPVSQDADAVEVVTDRNGEFFIPRHKIKQFRILHGWEPECTAIIFKPGYGAFPRHKKTKPRFDPSYSIPEDQYIVVWLPRLKTKEERRENLSQCGGKFYGRCIHMKNNASSWKCTMPNDSFLVLLQC